MAVKPNLELHIEELILRVFSPHDAHRIGEVVGRELERLFDEQGIPAMLSREAHFHNLNIGTVQLETPFQAEAVGEQIANNIYQGFNIESASTTHK